MTDEVGINLPAMRLVCHLVALSNITNPDPAVIVQSPPQHQAINELPCGYDAHPRVGLAYKYHWQYATFFQAMNICRQEGAQLAMIDTAEKVQVLKDWGVPKLYIHVGIIRVDDGEWINVNTESPPSSINWHSGYPTGSVNCAQFHPDDRGLTNIYKCSAKQPFVCEIPILPNSAVAVN